MKFQLVAALLGIGMLSVAPAFAQGQGENPNGTVMASMMKSGDVQMMVTMPDKEFQAMGQAMKAGHNACQIKEIYPGATDTMVLICDGFPGGS